MKKTFANQENPALAFISAQEPPAVQTKENPPAQRKQPAAPARAPEGYILKPEPKTRRLQLLLAPSLYDKIKAAADGADPKKTVNSLINEILADAMRTK